MREEKNTEYRNNRIWCIGVTGFIDCSQTGLQYRAHYKFIDRVRWAYVLEKENEISRHSAIINTSLIGGALYAE